MQKFSLVLQIRLAKVFVNLKKPSAFLFGNSSGIITEFQLKKKADDYHVKFLPVTEPDSDYFFFHIETVRNVLDFFRSGFWVLIEGSFKSNTNGGLDGGSFFTPPSKSVCSTQRTAIKSA
jgi:hypothetical protein